MKMKLITIAVAAFSLSGCGLLPYHDDDACQLEGSYGKCINGEQAYEEALYGDEIFGNYITEDGLTNEAPKAVVDGKATTNNGGVSRGIQNSDYLELKDRTYKELTALIEQPNTPMVKPVKVISHLILNYKTAENKRHMYMPRYIYTVAGEPEFLLNQYMLKKEDNSLDVLKMLK